MSGARPAKREDLVLRLASASPRRRELLALTGWEAEVSPAEVDEAMLSGEGPEDLAVRLARAKAGSLAGGMQGESLILAADTVVIDEDQMLGKPSDEAHAQRMLISLRGRTHRVVTALALIGFGSEVVESCSTLVPMRGYNHDEINAYVATGSPLDKAGGYGIQDRDFNPVDINRMEGCFANVMGLPLCHLQRAMRQFQQEPSNDISQACHSYTGYVCPVYQEILCGEM